MSNDRSTRFGPPDFFVRDDFFAPELCLQLVSQAQSKRSIKTGVVHHDGGGSYTNEHARRNKMLFLPDRTTAALSYKLMEVMPELETFFGIELMGCHPPQLLAYHPGDFFQRHQDRVRTPDRFILTRNLTVIVFVNQPGVDYAGGELVIYESEESEIGRVFPARSGQLLAFLPHHHHEVRPVTAGLRYTLIDWYY